MIEIRKQIRDQLIKLIGTFRNSPGKSSDTPVYRFLTYHRIKPGQEDPFRRQLDRLKKHYNIVSPSNYIKNLGSNKDLNLLLTFDDGYEEWGTFIVDELNKRNIKALFFVCPDFVGLDKASAASYCKNNIQVNPAPSLSLEGLDRIRSNGHTVGNHLIKHRDLRLETNQHTIQKSMEQSQELFYKNFDFNTNWLAYPFGDYFEKPAILQATAKKYFDYAVTLIPGVNTEDQSQVYLHREGFSPDFDRSTEDNWLRGGYDPLFYLTHLSGIKTGLF